ncbi:hypothetical protein LEP1GSC101_2264 [Leptospira borgpetersenii str. UI 09149]|nr:hypothetical protein LEP1GSC101_2264 [Leptospira borgpetersenii str. UI 09149]
MKKKETQISNQFLVWDGVFSSWEEAIRSAGDVDGKKGFSNEKWFERILEQLSSFRLEIKEFGIAVPPRTYKFTDDSFFDKFENHCRFRRFFRLDL